MGTQLKIVLADDDPDDRELFIELISELGVEVRALRNGRELLNYLDAELLEPPDCIFLDLNMPIMAGQECLTQIRGTDRFKNIPVVIYSTSANKKDIEDTFALGANLYLVKSSSYVSLKKTFETILKFDWQDFQPQNSLKNYVFNLG